MASGHWQPACRAGRWKAPAQNRSVSCLPPHGPGCGSCPQVPSMRWRGRGHKAGGGKGRRGRWLLQKALRIDIDLELELALRLRRRGEPFPQIGGEIERARRLDQEPEAMA